MDSRTYTRELLDKHLLPELKEIAQGLGIIPEGNKTRRETWVAALVGQPFPIFQSIAPEEPIENSPGVEVDPVEEPLVEAVEDPPGVEVDPVRRKPDYLNCPACGTVGGLYPVCPGTETVWETRCTGCDYAEPCIRHPFEDVRPFEVDRPRKPIENPPGTEVDPAREPLVETVEKSLDADRAQELIEFPDLESALAEIARLRAQNEKLLELARSQSEIIRRAKDISPVVKPSRCRVERLAQAACLDVSKAFNGGWVLSMGKRLKRGFKTLKEIWELLIVDDWKLEELFRRPTLPVAKKTIFTAATHTRYSAIPFCDDDLIDTWRLGINAVLNGRSPPAGGEAM